MTAAGDWASALDALSARLRAQADFVAGVGPYPEGAWSPPDGPLPEPYRLRVALLAQESTELAARVAHARRRIGDGAGVISPYR